LRIVQVPAVVYSKLRVVNGIDNSQYLNNLEILRETQLKGEMSKTPVIFQNFNNTCDLTIYQNLFHYFTSFVTETYYSPFMFHCITITPVDFTKTPFVAGSTNAPQQLGTSYSRSLQK
jgi:hypothetical protein